MTIFTKLASAIFAAFDSSGALRRVDNADVATWGTEVERLLSSGGFKTIDAQGPFSGRAAYNAQPKGFTYLSIDGDGVASSMAVGFIKKSNTSGDWSVAIPWQGPAGPDGEPGPAGEGFNPAGAWLVGATYSKNDMVSFGGRSFVSFASGNVGHQPPSSDADDAYWQFVPAAVGPEGPQGPVGNTGATGSTGATGATGPANTLTIGTVTEGTAGATITGAAPNQTLNLVIPKGDTGATGAEGDDGWTPVLAVVADGARRVQQVADWTGGTGTKPATGKYVGATGLVDLIANGVDIRGASGAGTGDVVGPASSTDNRLARFNGITGKLLKDGGTVATADIADNAVTYGKMQDVTATARVLGRKSAGAGDPEELTLSEVLDMVGSAAQGDILFRGASGWFRLPKGSALQLLRQNAALTAPEWATIAQREVLTANRTYYVRTDGSDSNNGLANTSGGAFLTIQKAINTILSLDLGGFDVTIAVADGTYTAPVSITKNWVGGNLIISGSTSAILDIVSNHAITTTTPLANVLTISGLKLSTSGAGDCLRNSGGGKIIFNGTEFGACAATHVNADAVGALIEAGGNYTITGSAAVHAQGRYGGMVRVTSRTITLTGTPAFSTAFAQADQVGNILMNGDTFTGSATGKRYNAVMNGVIQTGAGGANALPGSVAGTTATGGQYQ